MPNVPQTAKTTRAGEPVTGGFVLLVEAPPQSPQDTKYPGNDGFTIGCVIFTNRFGHLIRRIVRRIRCPCNALTNSHLSRIIRPEKNADVRQEFSLDTRLHSLFIIVKTKYRLWRESVRSLLTNELRNQNLKERRTRMSNYTLETLPDIISAAVLKEYLGISRAGHITF